MNTKPHVTQREFDYPDDATLMSTTDTQSYVTYANEAFVDISGFTRAEIQGQPHNFVRHPDMPKEAFADMWATLKGGEPWTALVKNRRKDGDHYWVRANAVPVVRNGQQAGYMSVRTKPTRDEVAGAEALYRSFREGRAGHLKFHKGLLIRTGLASLLSMGQKASVRSRIRLTMFGMWLALVGGTASLVPATAGLLGLAAMAAAAAVAASLVLEAQVAKPLETLAKQALNVATGASRSVVPMNRVDEIGMTMRAVGQLGLMFRWLIDDVSQQVMTLKSAITEIAQGNNDLSSRTEQAAASVEETASAMEEMTGTVKNNAEVAQQAHQISGTATAAARAGGAAVGQVVATMDDITASSKKVVDIISVIDGIAFQTNILALNAAVEAARAGDQGRGFAVVASEVRGLAQRSAAAAKEIKVLIGASVDKVEVGAKLVADAGRTMDEIVSQVSRVSGLIGDITSATIEQSSGISEVGQAVGHLDQITQQNAALVEEGAAASQSLQQQAERLAEAVSVFR